MADDGLQATEAVVYHALLLEKPAMQIVAVLGKAGPLVDHKGRQAREFHTDSKPTAGSAAWRSMTLFVAPDSISLGGTLQVGDWEEDADNLASLSDWKGRSILLAGQQTARQLLRPGCLSPSRGMQHCCLAV